MGVPSLQFLVVIPKVPLDRIRRALLRRPSLARILANFSWLMVDRAVRLGLGLLVSLSPVGVYDLVKWWYRRTRP